MQRRRLQEEVVPVARAAAGEAAGTVRGRPIPPTHPLSHAESSSEIKKKTKTRWPLIVLCLSWPPPPSANDHDSSCPVAYPSPTDLETSQT